MNISDETLMAYLDNELDGEERARVDAQVASDPETKARLERQARVHAMLNAAFDPVVRQSVPERLVATAMTTPASLRWRIGEAASRLVSPNGQGFAPRFALAAATLLIGVALGWAITASRDGSLISGEPLVAHGDLEHALDTRLASDEAAAGPRVGVTFRSKAGAFCRTFETGGTANAAGVACRDATGWSVQTVTRVAPRTSTPYEVAGAAMPQTVRNAIAEMIDGTPFDAGQERQARDQGWR